MLIRYNFFIEKIVEDPEMRLSLIQLVFACGLSGCATIVPQFDIPSNEAGPTVKSIAREIECELDEIAAGGTGFDKFLLKTHDVGVAVNLSLAVTDDGKLAPTFTYVQNVIFGVSGGVSFEQSRADTFQQDLFYSMSDRIALLKVPQQNICGELPNTNLSGKLGLKAAWDLELTDLTSANWSSTTANGGLFSKTITFTVNKNLSATGPTWTLAHFTGPGQFLTASESNVDTLTVAFVQGPGSKDRGVVARAAFNYLQAAQNGNATNYLAAIAAKH